METSKKTIHSDYYIGISIFFLSYFLLFYFFLMEDKLFSNDGINYYNILNNSNSLSDLVKNNNQTFMPTFLILSFYIREGLHVTSFQAAVLYSLLFGAAIPVVVYFTSLKIFRSQALSLASALLTLLNPSYRDVVCNYLRDSASLLLVSISVMFFVFNYYRPKTFYISSAIIIIAFSLGFRYENIEFFFLFLFLQFLLIIFDSQNTIRKKIKGISKLLFVYAISFITGLSIVFFVILPTSFFTISRLSLIFEKYFNKFFEQI